MPTGTGVQWTVVTAALQPPPPFSILLLLFPEAFHRMLLVPCVNLLNLTSCFSPSPCAMFNLDPDSLASCPCPRCPSLPGPVSSGLSAPSWMLPFQEHFSPAFTQTQPESCALPSSLCVHAGHHLHAIHLPEFPFLDLRLHEGRGVSYPPPAIGVRGLQKQLSVHFLHFPISFWNPVIYQPAKALAYFSCTPLEEL